MKEVGVFFDLDGVLVYECGATDFGYAFLFNLLLDQEFEPEKRIADLYIDKVYLDMVPSIRPRIKGTHFLAKIGRLWSILNVSEVVKSRYTAEECARYYLRAYQYYVLANHPASSYVITEGIYLLYRLQALQKCFFSTLTANEEAQARWLLAYSGAQFDNILAFRYDRPEITDKIALLQDYLRTNAFERVVVIGDGPMDIRAGKAVGAYTVGIAWSYESREALEAVSCDFICDKMNATYVFDAIVRHLKWN